MNACWRGGQSRMRWVMVVPEEAATRPGPEWIRLFRSVVLDIRDTRAVIGLRWLKVVKKVFVPKYRVL